MKPVLLLAVLAGASVSAGVSVAMNNFLNWQRCGHGYDHDMRRLAWHVHYRTPLETCEEVRVECDIDYDVMPKELSKHAGETQE